MLGQVQLESARPGDARAIARLSRDAIERGLGWRYTPQAVAGLIADAEVEVVVARVDGHVAGFGIMQFDFAQRRAHLVLLAVEASRRRRGFGQKLLAWLETLARRGGALQIHLEVRAGNRGARAFYRGLGYRDVARLRGYYAGREDAVRMQRRFTRSRPPA